MKTYLSEHPVFSLDLRTGFTRSMSRLYVLKVMAIDAELLAQMSVTFSALERYEEVWVPFIGKELGVTNEEMESLVPHLQTVKALESLPPTLEGLQELDWYKAIKPICQRIAVQVKKAGMRP